MSFLHQAITFKANSIRSIIALSAGALMALAFAPFYFYWLPFLCLAVLALLCFSSSVKQSFYYGLAFGFGMFVVGTSWVYVSMNVYGGMPPWMGAIAVIFFSLLLGMFVAGACLVSALISSPKTPRRLISLPICWVVFEWMKSWVFTGFPWLDIGYTQTPSWLFSFAPVGGVYLVSFSVISLSVCLLACYVLPHRRILSISSVVGIMMTLWLASSIEWSEPIAKPIQVGIVQGNTPINQKWSPHYRDKVITNLQNMAFQLSEEAIRKGESLDLVVFAETALPLYFQQTNDSFWQEMMPSKTALLTGLVDSPSVENTYNAALLNCNGQKQLYRKRHLVPFGEYMPLRSLFGWILDYLQLPMSDFAAWQGEQSLQCGDNIRIGLSICYEDAFAWESRHFNQDATLLVNISEDAWFGDSFAPHQRLQIGQMRAFELSRPMIRSANSGPSAIINHKGQVIAKTGQFEPAVLVHEVQPRQGATLFKQFGNWIVWLSLILIVLLYFLTRAKR